MCGYAIDDCLRLDDNSGSLFTGDLKGVMLMEKISHTLVDSKTPFDAKWDP